MSSRPSSGMMVYWRFKQEAPTPWKFGYVRYINENMIRMGRWNGDSVDGPVVSVNEIEWREYH